MSLQFLERWYQQQCNGFWEHGQGVTIETLAQPGWMVTVDLVETPLEDKSLAPVRLEVSDKDWLVCEVTHKQFRGQGDVRKLLPILEIFEKWAAAVTPPLR